MLDAHGTHADDLHDMPVFGGASCDAPPARLRPLRQTTLDLPARLQFDAWRDINAGLVEYQTPATMPESYEVTATAWSFGGLVLQEAETPAGSYRRSATCLRRDGLDLWAFSMATHGLRVYRTREQTIVMRSGQLLLHSFAQPFDAARTRSGWLHLYMPREELSDLAGLVAPGVHLLDTPGGLLLRDHLLLLAQELPRMSPADGERMAEATRAMVALAVAPTPARQEAAAAPVAGVQIMRIRGMMRAHLGQATLGPARLCQMAGISRSQLYRLFEPHGGVALFIQRERLNAAHRALSDTAEARSISEIAESVGLFDPSSFSRMFRRTFGRSPRELRMARSAGALAAARRQGAPGPGASCLADLLRAM